MCPQTEAKIPIQYRAVQNFDRGNFDKCWLFKYLTENILMDHHCLIPSTWKRCSAFKKFDRLNFDGLAENIKISPINILHYKVLYIPKLVFYLC